MQDDHEICLFLLTICDEINIVIHHFCVRLIKTYIADKCMASFAYIVALASIFCPPLMAVSIDQMDVFVKQNDTHSVHRHVCRVIIQQ